MEAQQAEVPAAADAPAAAAADPASAAEAGAMELESWGVDEGGVSAPAAAAAP